MMSLFVVPAILALLFKGRIIYLSRGDAYKSTLLTPLIYTLFIFNIAECAIQIQFHNGATADWVLRSYFVTSVWCLALIFCYSMSISLPSKLYLISKIAIGSTVFLTALIIFTDTVLLGAHSIEYTYAALRGDYYWGYHIFAATLFLATVSTLIFGYKKAEIPKERVQCLHVLFALSPIVVAGLGISLVMATEFKVNAIGILPIATTLFLLIMLNSEKSQGLTDVRKFLPFSKERRLLADLMRVQDKYTLHHISHTTFKRYVEKIALEYQMQVHDRSVSTVAKAVKTNRTTIDSAVKRHNIEKAPNES